MDDRTWLTAWHAANVIAPHVKGRISPDKLLGRSRSLAGMSFKEAGEYYRNKRERGLE